MILALCLFSYLWTQVSTSTESAANGVTLLVAQPANNEISKDIVILSLLMNKTFNVLRDVNDLISDNVKLYQQDISNYTRTLEDSVLPFGNGAARNIYFNETFASDVRKIRMAVRILEDDFFRYKDYERTARSNVREVEDAVEKFSRETLNKINPGSISADASNSNNYYRPTSYYWRTTPTVKTSTRRHTDGYQPYRYYRYPTSTIKTTTRRHTDGYQPYRYYRYPTTTVKTVIRKHRDDYYTSQYYRYPTSTAKHADESVRPLGRELLNVVKSETRLLRDRLRSNSRYLLDNVLSFVRKAEDAALELKDVGSYQWQFRKILKIVYELRRKIKSRTKTFNRLLMSKIVELETLIELEVSKLSGTFDIIGDDLVSNHINENSS